MVYSSKGKVRRLVLGQSGGGCKWGGVTEVIPCFPSFEHDEREAEADKPAIT